MNKRTLIIALIVLVALNLVTLAMLWRPYIVRPERERENPGEMLKKRLNLSVDQRNKMDTLREDHFRQIQTTERELRAMRRQVFESNVRNQPVEAVDSLLVEVGQLQKQLDSLTYRHFLEMRAICSEEQQVALNALMEDLLGKRFGKGGPENRRRPQRNKPDPIP